LSHSASPEREDVFVGGGMIRLVHQQAVSAWGGCGPWSILRDGEQSGYHPPRRVILRYLPKKARPKKTPEKLTSDREWEPWVREPVTTAEMKVVLPGQQVCDTASTAMAEGWVKLWHTQLQKSI
jgi:hypothetical protein